jgi:Dihydrofolate reductase
MRKIILWMQLSIDGVATNPDQWGTFTDEMLYDAIAYYEQIDTVIIGHNSYAALAAYWQRAEKESPSEAERTFAKKINSIRKLIISQSKAAVLWNNAEPFVVRTSLSFIKEIEKMRNSAGKNISVESGLRTWQSFIEHRLFNELWMQLHPVVVGTGEKLFDSVKEKLPLQLIESRTYQHGVVGLRYKYEGEQ